MPLLKRPISWLPHSLRWQFLVAVSALTLLILAGGITAVYALRSSAETIRLLAEKRLVQMQDAQDLVHKTLLIERESYQLADAQSLTEMREIYEDISTLLKESDDLVYRLAADNGGNALLDVHQSSQLFRNTVNVVAHLWEQEMLSGGKDKATTPPDAGHPRLRYLSELHRQAEALLSAAQFQSKYFTKRYRESVQQLDNVTRRNVQWVTLLLAASLALAWAVAQWFLGRHVLGRLLRVSRNLRLGDSGAAGEKSRVTAKSDRPPRDEIDEMAYAVELFREDRRQLGLRTEQLRLARDAAEAANKAKSVFLANMSHELRTPLNAILGFSNILRQQADLSEEQHQNLDIIIHSGEHLLRLINDVLEIAKIEAGKLQLDIASFDLQAMVKDVADMMRLRAEQKGMLLELDQSSEFPRFIKGDEARLRQILVNLVGNAVKFTDRGCVTIRLGVSNNLIQHLRIEVEDTGPGITQEDQLNLFKPFAQTAEGTMRGGTGLGLSIVHQFVDLMGGTVAIESTLGKGSLFRVELPLELADVAEVFERVQVDRGDVIALAPNQGTRRILIADDQRDNQLLLAKLMTDVGLEVKIANNGKECVQLFEAWNPDLILMDWRMPVMDGVEAASRIRRLPNGKEVKIVAVTASAFKEQLPELSVAGMDDYVRKPYRFREIYDILTRQLGLEFVYRTEPQTVSARPFLPTPAQLQAITAEQRDRLHAALEALDSTQIAAAIEEIGTVDAGLAQILTQLANEFDYPSMLGLLDAEFTDQ